MFISGLLFLLCSVDPIRTAIQRLPAVSINEQSSIGTSIYDLTRVYTSSSSNAIQFSFLSDTSSHNGFFILDSLTGRISIKRMIDREELCQTHVCQCERCVLTLEIIAASQTIDILSLDVTIDNINDNQPVFPVSNFQIRLAETTDVGHIASFPAATDLDYHDRLEYQCIPLDDVIDPELLQTFAIVHLQTENQLGLRLLKSLDRETRSLYQMKVLASDGEHTGQLLLDVHVLDSNDNVPKFEREQYQIKLPENTPIGSDVLRLRASDNDQGSNARLNYTIMSNMPSSSFPFGIDVSTGVIELIRSLDYEHETNYQFNVRARDNGPDAISVYTQVQIDVLDVNDCSPEIDFILPDSSPQKDSLFVEEEKDVQTRLFHISVSDKDSTNEKIQLKLLTYEHLFQLHEQYKDLYSLLIVGRLDREVQEEYRLVFEASDQGNGSSLTSQKHMTIILTDINDCSPVLESYPSPITIEENNPPHVRLIQFHAHDLDAPNTSNSLLSYSLVPSHDSRLFEIDSQTGILSVGHLSFDYESKSNYHLILNISDRGEYPKRLETLQPLTIAIKDLNDNPPRFESDFYSFDVLENSTVGTLIGQVKAVDIDVNTTISYQLDDAHAFELDRFTGQLLSKVRLDFEKQSIYHLSLFARDNDDRHSAQVNVTIRVLDINDHAPIVDTPSSVYISSEVLQSNGSDPWVMITRVIATDRDEGQNGNLTYRIIDGNSKNYFHINSVNGTITSERHHLPQGYHRLTIDVCDQGERDVHCSTGMIHVKVGENVDHYFYSTLKTEHEPIEKRHLSDHEPVLTREIVLVVVISSILTVVFVITIGIFCAFCCKQKQYHRNSSKQPCESLQSTDGDRLLSPNPPHQMSPSPKKLTDHHRHLEPFENIKAGGSGVSSEDSCYGSNELSRSSSSTHAVARPLLATHDRSPSLSSTSVDETLPVHRQVSSFETKTITSDHSDTHPSQDNYLTTFHSPVPSLSSSHYNLKKTIQSLTRRPMTNLHSTYLTYDSIDTPPLMMNSALKEYNIA